MELNPQAFANSLAATSVLFYLVLFILKIIAPPFFNLILNSQFFGADVASQIGSLSPFKFLGILIAIATISWVVGYTIATFYNRFLAPKTPKST